MAEQLRQDRSAWLTKAGAPLVLTWLAFALRLIGLTRQSLWRDEVDALLFATRPLAQLLQMFRRPGENGPLFFLALRPWLAAAGHSEFALRFPSALAGALAVPIVYILMRRLGGRKPATVAALLMATAPYLIWYGQEAKMYALLTALAPLALLLTVDAALRGRWWRWVLLYGVTSLCFYTHVLAALIVPVQALWLLILPLPAGRRAAWRRLGAVAGYLAALLLPYLPLVWWQAKLWLSPTFETGHPFVPLDDILTVLLAAFSRGVLPVGKAWTLGPSIFGLISAGAWAAGRHRAPARAEHADREGLGGWRPVALLGIWLLLPPLGVYGISLGMPIFTDRYLIWALPAFVGLIALGVVALARSWRPLGLMTLAVILALNLVGTVKQFSLPVKSDFRSAAGYVLANRQPGDLLIYQIPYIRFTFTYYSSGRADPNDATLPWLDGPYTNNTATEADVAAKMAQGTAAAPAAWLIASEAPMWDRRGLTEAWLAGHGEVTHHAEFARVTVTRYKLER